MNIMRRGLSLLLAAAMLLTGMTALAEAPAEALTLQPGDALHGFTVTEVYDCAMLNSMIYTFKHTYSGATLVYVSNDDPELAFSIGYRTPYVDETDTNHVFEHAILSGSGKYPSSDIFFDLVNHAFKTFANAQTFPTLTRYPLASTSEEQLLKMVDVYMSCMVDPDVLKDERIFQREAIRFELDDPAGDIQINGTVFAEDVGFLTDMGDNALNNLLDALYPGEVASNGVGRAQEHYRDLTYAHTIETYERCYHFDNSLIFLYGDLDLERFLTFLDEEYLSKYPVYGTDLSAWEDGTTPAGFVDVTVPVPAYEGSVTENASRIFYAIDLDGATEVELNQYSLLCSALNMVGSPLYNNRIERGIENPVSVGVAAEFAKPVLYFAMSYANPDQKEELKALAEDTLAQVASEGIDPEVFELIEKSLERSSKLIRNGTNVGVDLASDFMIQWARSGDANCYRPFEQALRALKADGQQQIIRSMALNLLTPRRSALVANVPTPGLAEAYEAERDQYLADMKANMSQAELEAMVAETAAFNEWNETQFSNSDFTISPEDLPDPTMPEWTVEDVDGVTVYRGASSLDGVGTYAIYFDLRGMSREELMVLMLSNTYRLQMDSAEHTADELYRLWQTYVSDFSVEEIYPNAETGDYHRPMLKVSWSCLDEDFDACLDLIMEVLAETDYSDADMLTYLTNVSAEAWDMSRQDGDDIAYRASHTHVGLMADTQKLFFDVDGQDCYTLISGIAERLNTEEGYAAELAEQYHNAVSKAFGKGDMIFMAVATQDAGDAIVEKAVDVLNALPEKPGEPLDYALPEMADDFAICIEDSVTNSYLVGDYMRDEDFVGSYLPFVNAFSALYTTPTFRFQLGVYTASTNFQWAQGCLYTRLYSDPNPDKTLPALADLPQTIQAMALTQEELNNYILSAYSTVVTPLGALNEVMTWMQYDLLGMDAERVLAIKSDIRNATVDQLSEAAEHIAKVFENAALATAGNEALIRANADCYDEVVSWLHND